MIFIVVGLVQLLRGAPADDVPHVVLIALGAITMAVGGLLQLWVRRILSCGIEVSPVGIRITRALGQRLVVPWREVVGFEAEGSAIRMPALLVHLRSGNDVRTYMPVAQLQTPWRALARPWELFLWPWKLSDVMMATAEAAVARLEEHLRDAHERGSKDLEP